MTHETFLHCFQSSTTDIQKRNSVRHKLVSLTLKKKTKITEEVYSKESITFPNS